MKYYPVYFNITNRMCVVVGGGDIAERKIARLLECGASVVVVGKKLGPKLVDMKSEGKIKHIAGDYQEKHIRNAFLVIGATDRDDVNERIYRDAKRNGIPANIVDDPGRCDFILPSIFQQGDLQIAISTGGKSPALAKRLRLEMEKNYGPEYKTLLDIMGAVREKVITKGRPSEENKELFESLLNSDILRHIQEKNISKVKKIVNDLTGEDIDGQ
jgi:precorrin-2 dehydrogenase/sirohydrochlorin ferrochelatase